MSLRQSLSHLRLLRLFTTESTRVELRRPGERRPVNTAHLLRVCTVLYQQQESSESRLHARLGACEFELTHEFFLQVCEKFPRSWRPVYRFFGFTKTRSDFAHTSVSFNKMANVIARSRNIDLLWQVVGEMARLRLANDRTFHIALRTLAAARELSRCVKFFHVMNAHDYGYRLETLNSVVDALCGCKLVDEARFIVYKLKPWVRPCAVTYGFLIRGFCEGGDLMEAARVWNKMVDEGLEPGIDASENIMETYFKRNRFGEALKLFEAMQRRTNGGLGLSSYRLVINWMCIRGKIEEAQMVFDEMRRRGIKPDNATLGSLVYGLVASGRVEEGYEIVERVEKPDVGVYHGLMKGLLRLKRPGEATQVFREMIRRGCEPTMHTYIMLLQGHMGMRGMHGPDGVANFDSIFVGGLVRAGKSWEATKYVERVTHRVRGPGAPRLDVPRFDYNKFLYYYSNEEGVVMFEEVGRKLRDVGLLDLADIFQRYGEKMTTRVRRVNRAVEP